LFLNTLIELSPALSVWKKITQRLNTLFILTVLLPFAVAFVYFGLIASDVYISEARFVVRNPQRQSATGLGSLLQGTGFARSQDDTYSVHDYVLSRDALRELDQELRIRKALSAPTVDWVNRFGSLYGDESFEAFFKHYRNHVTIDYDTVSSITTLYVRAYNAEDARNFNDLLLKMSERLVNNLNTRSRQDLIRVAQQEVSVAEERAKGATLALSGYRNQQTVFDPDRQSALQLQGVAKLQDELLAAEAQLTQLRLLSPQNPQVPALQSRIGSLKTTITAENAKVTGGNGSFSAKATGYDRLALDKTFADRQLATALASLEAARNEAQRKQLYLERLVQPNLPDRAMEPKRVRSIFTVLVLGLILWGVMSLVMASVKEHGD
jgi:capsular polysaccharide transport system permease protein